MGLFAQPHPVLSNAIALADRVIQPLKLPSGHGVPERVTSPFKRANQAVGYACGQVAIARALCSHYTRRTTDVASSSIPFCIRFDLRASMRFQLVGCGTSGETW
jgi:hypothetical protein